MGIEGVREFISELKGGLEGGSGCESILIKRKASEPLRERPVGEWENENLARK